MFELLFGHPPFKADNHIQLLSTIDSTKSMDEILARSEQAVNKSSPECMDLLQKLLTKDPEKRISIQGLFTHPFVKTRQASKNMTRVNNDLNPVSANLIKPRYYRLAKEVRKIDLVINGKENDRYQKLLYVVSTLVNCLDNFNGVYQKLAADITLELISETIKKAVKASSYNVIFTLFIQLKGFRMACYGV